MDGSLCSKLGACSRVEILSKQLERLDVRCKRKRRYLRQCRSLDCLNCMLPMGLLTEILSIAKTFRGATRRSSPSKQWQTAIAQISRNSNQKVIGAVCFNRSLQNHRYSPLLSTKAWRMAKTNMQCLPWPYQPNLQPVSIS